ncbi:hypothetical protein FIBSPDRAFT_875842, partial [Athelia psychrophila]
MLCVLAASVLLQDRERHGIRWDHMRLHICGRRRQRVLAVWRSGCLEAQIGKQNGLSISWARSTVVDEVSLENSAWRVARSRRVYLIIG